MIISSHDPTTTANCSPWASISFAENCIGLPPLPPVVPRSSLCQVDNHGAKLDGHADRDRFSSNNFFKASSSLMSDRHP